MGSIYEIVLGSCVIASLFLGAMFCGYVCTIIGPFIRRKSSPLGRAEHFDWHFVIPCRDEEAVIFQTLDFITSSFPTAQVWVVDDDSTDRTSSIVLDTAESRPQIRLLQRRLPDARSGKAHALNFAWREMRPHITDQQKAIFVVIDADGRPSPNMMSVCSGSEGFGDPHVGAVQIEVRMSNRHAVRPLPGEDWARNLVARTFVRMQDIEFRSTISAIQVSRRVSKTVNVGGNGQLTRFSALEAIANEEGPWRGSLLEDFELGLHLLLGGWKNAYLPDAWVDQEALFDLPRFLTQRARWAQGTMQCFRYLRNVWVSGAIGNLGALEISYFLLQPWIQILGTFVYPVPVLVMVYNAYAYPAFFAEFLSHGGGAMLAVYSTVGLIEFAIWGVLYKLYCERDASWGEALYWGLSYVLYMYLVYAVAWKALDQVLRGQRGWAKTIRNSENVASEVLVARTT